MLLIYSFITIDHGIQSQKERGAWKRAFRDVFLEKGLKTLDVGCGTGELSLLFAEMGHKVAGIDISRQMLKVAKVKAEACGVDITFREGDAENPPFDKSSFDIVLSRHLLWTLPHPDTAVQNWKKVLVERGKLIVIDGVWNDGSIETNTRRLVSDFLALLVERRNPRKGHYSREIDSELPNRHRVPPEKMLEYFRAAGFKNIKDLDLKDIMNLQKENMPFRKRIAYSYRYHLIYGEK